MSIFGNLVENSSSLESHFFHVYWTFNSINQIVGNFVFLPNTILFAGQNYSAQFQFLTELLFTLSVYNEMFISPFLITKKNNRLTNKPNKPIRIIINITFYHLCEKQFKWLHPQEKTHTPWETWWTFNSTIEE